MAKTPEERPEIAAPIPEPEKSGTARVRGRTLRYNPTPGYTLLVCGVDDYGDPLPEPRMKAYGPPKLGMTDQAAYLLASPKPQQAKAIDWWREAEPAEMAAYQQETGAFGLEPAALVAELRAEWKAARPWYREGPPPHPTTEHEERLAKALATALTQSKGGTQ